MTKWVLFQMNCSVCGESELLRGEYDTDDEKTARLMQIEEHKQEIINFHSLHYAHTVEMIPKYHAAGGLDEESKIYGAAQWCNIHIRETYGTIE